MFNQERAAQDQGLSGEALLTWRQANIAPITCEFKKWLAIVHPHTVAKTPLREATDYYSRTGSRSPAAVRRMTRWA